MLPERNVADDPNDEETTDLLLLVCHQVDELIEQNENIDEEEEDD